MKKHFSPFLKALIKENFLFILLGLILPIILIFIFLFFLPNLWEIDSKKRTLNQEIKKINDKLTFTLNYAKNNPVDNQLKTLSSLIPLKEDYFSIIYSLENLSKKTGFIINSYTINLSSSTPEKFKITITGNADKQTFLNFLKKYNFEGGRLITADQISLSEEGTSLISINLTFYNAPISEISNHDFDLPNLQNQINKMQAVLKNLPAFENTEATAEGEINLYPKRSNPF